MHFVTCPRQGLEMEAVVLHRVGFLAYFCPKQGQDFKPSAAPLYPNMGQVPPGWIPHPSSPYQPLHQHSRKSTHLLTKVFLFSSQYLSSLLNLFLFWVLSYCFCCIKPYKFKKCNCNSGNL